MSHTVTHRQLIRPADRKPQLVPVVAGMYVPADAVEAAYFRHYREVYRYVLALTGSPPDAEEIAADVFERALRSWSTTPEPTLPWLLLVARRIALDRWRRARRFARLITRLDRPSPSDGGEDRAEFWAWFNAVARILTDRQREVLALRYESDLTDAQIAKIMGLSESGVRSLVGRALEALRAHPEVL